MLTKGDLSAIKSVVQDEVTLIIKKEVGLLKKEIVGVKGELILRRSDLNRNTKDLTDLILAGFSTHEPMLSNHEKRLTHIESISFKSN